MQNANLSVSPENCGCFHHGESLQAEQERSTHEHGCTCHAGGYMACHNICCGEDEECQLVNGFESCHPKPEVAYCSVGGTLYSTCDVEEFEFPGSCNYSIY